METTMIKANGTMVNNKGGKEMSTMVKVNEEIRYHCLHCNEILNKKERKYCNRDCYNASRKTGDKTVKAPVKTSVSSEPVNNIVAFEKALLNMQKFESALTLHRLKKLVTIAGERALVIRVDAGIVINWVVGDKCYLVYYRPKRVITYKTCEFEAMKDSINRLMKRTTFKDALKITEYVKLAEQMKGGE